MSPNCLDTHISITCRLSSAASLLHGLLHSSGPGAGHHGDSHRSPGTLTTQRHSSHALRRIWFSKDQRKTSFTFLQCSTLSQYNFMLTPQHSHTTFKTTVKFNTLSLIALKLSYTTAPPSTSSLWLLWRWSLWRWSQ